MYLIQSKKYDDVLNSKMHIHTIFSTKKKQNKKYFIFEGIVTLQNLLNSLEMWQRN